jgi:hypothetical protein
MGHHDDDDKYGGMSKDAYVAVMCISLIVYFGLLGGGIWGCVRAGNVLHKQGQYTTALILMIIGALICPPLMIGPIVIGALAKPPHGMSQMPMRQFRQ